MFSFSSWTRKETETHIPERMNLTHSVDPGSQSIYHATDENMRSSSGPRDPSAQPHRNKPVPKLKLIVVVFLAFLVFGAAFELGRSLFAGPNTVDNHNGEPAYLVTSSKGKKKEEKKKGKKGKSKSTTTTAATTQASGFNCSSAVFNCVRDVCSIDQDYLDDPSCAANLGGGSYALGALIFYMCPETTTILVPQVTLVCGDLIVQGNANLNSVSFPDLESVNGDVFGFGFDNNPSLSSIDMPVLASVPEGLIIQSCPSLTSISFPALASTGEFAIQSNPSLTSISFPALASTGSFSIQSNPSLTSISLPALTSAATQTDQFFDISDNANGGQIATCTVGNGGPPVSPNCINPTQATCDSVLICGDD